MKLRKVIRNFSISEVLQRICRQDVEIIANYNLYYLHFDWYLLACGQFVIALNFDVTPADNRFLHVDMM